MKNQNQKEETKKNLMELAKKILLKNSNSLRQVNPIKTEISWVATSLNLPTTQNLPELREELKKNHQEMIYHENLENLPRIRLEEILKKFPTKRVLVPV